MIKAVIFDLDNTLYHYDYCNGLAEKVLFAQISAEFGVSVEGAATMLQKAKGYVKRQLGHVAASHNRLLYMQNICEQAGKNPIVYAMKFYDVYWNVMLREMVPFEYVNPLIDSLRRKNIKTGILTDMTAHIQYKKIMALGLKEKIDYIVTSEEVGVEKPSVKMFGLMLEKMAVKPDEVIMIGDSQVKDIRGALQMGMKTLLFENGMNMYECVITLLE